MPVYKDKKHNTRYAKFCYKDWRGNTRFTTKRGFAAKRDAVEFESNFKLHIAGNLDMTFAEFCKVYREDHYPRIRKSTIAAKDHIIDQRLIPYFGRLKITEIKAKDIVKWQNELLSYKNPKTGKPFPLAGLDASFQQAIMVLSVLR